MKKKLTWVLGEELTAKICISLGLLSLTCAISLSSTLVCPPKSTCQTQCWYSFRVCSDNGETGCSPRYDDCIDKCSNGFWCVPVD